MKFNLNKLKGLMKEKNLTQEDIAKELNISKSTFNLKLNSNAYFSQTEIYKIGELLSIPAEQYLEYFFTLKV